MKKKIGITILAWVITIVLFRLLRLGKGESDDVAKFVYFLSLLVALAVFLIL